MSTTGGRTGPGPSSGRSPRPPSTPSSRLLLAASLLTLTAALLPWVTTSFTTFWGLDGPGRWTLYAGFLGLAGAILRRPRLVAAHAGVLAVVAIGLPSWQMARLAALCPLGGCLPSIGLLLTGLAGAMALRATWLAVGEARRG